MSTLELTSYAPTNTFVSAGPKDHARAIKQAMSAYRKILGKDLPTKDWGAPIRVAQAARVGMQDLTGCGCGCS
jgi:hypothetical protein